MSYRIPARHKKGEAAGQDKKGIISENRQNAGEKGSNGDSDFAQADEQSEAAKAQKYKVMMAGIPLSICL